MVSYVEANANPVRDAIANPMVCVGSLSLSSQFSHIPVSRQERHSRTWLKTGPRNQHGHRWPDVEDLELNVQSRHSPPPASSDKTSQPHYGPRAPQDR